MSQQRDTANLTRDVVAATAKHTLMKLDGSGNLVTNGLNERPLGPLTQSVKAGRPGSVDLMQNKPGTVRIIAAGVIALNATVTAAAAGKGSTGGTENIGIALEAATADGDVIEVIPALSDL